VVEIFKAYLHFQNKDTDTLLSPAYVTNAKKKSKANNDFVVSDIKSNETQSNKRKAEETLTEAPSKKSKKSAKVLPNFSLESPKTKKNKREKLSKKSVAVKAVSPKKSFQKSNSGIKISLKHNKQHEFSDYSKSIQASPAVPYQPDRTPLKTALKATSSPILVKKPFGKTLKSIPTKSRKEPKVAMSTNTTEIKKKAKISPTVMKEMKRQTKKAELSAKPVQRKRATAADFF